MRQIKRARKRERVKKKLISIVVLCLLSVILFSTAAASEKSGTGSDFYEGEGRDDVPGQ